MTLEELLDLLGHHTVALCWKQQPDGDFTTHITTPQHAAAKAAQLTTSDVWYSINEPAGPPWDQPSTRRGRGGADHITRLRALWADLDIKPGGYPDIDAAEATITDLSIILGTEPVAVIASGHGLQPIWAIEPDDQAADLHNTTDRARANTLLNRWRRLVETVAATRGASVDAVYDLPRILRAPDTINWKHTPVRATAERRHGAPLTLNEITEHLDEYGVEELPSDELLDQPVDTSTWTWADHTCPYAKKMIDQWGTDDPTARHPWLISQATRLELAHRHGCLTHTDHQRAQQVLGTRMAQLCATGNARNLADAELRDALRWGARQAAHKTDQQVAKELGGHDHNPQLTVIDGNNIAAIAATFGQTAASTAPARRLAAADAPLQVTLTDDGNARLFVHAHGHHLRYSAARGWLDWNGHRWRISEDDAPAVQAARGVATHLPEDTKEQARHRTKTLARAGIENMVALARRDAVIRVTADELDSHRMMLNTPDGTINLADSVLHEHRPGELHTKITGTGYQPEQPTPRWLKYLNDTFGSDQELIDYLQRLLGYAITGRVTHHILPFFHGDGQNGKSVLTDVLFGVLGDYAIALPSSVLIAQRYSHDSELSKLPGARVAIASEVPTNGTFDEERVKMLTGGDLISARELYKNPFQFTPSHTLILSGNHQPSVESGGRSFWRRTRLIPFNHTVPDDQKIEGLGPILVEEEGPGILAWMVAGTRAAANGLREPDSVKEATKAYEIEEDSFGAFVTDCLHQAPGSDIVKVKTTDLRKTYSSWCRDNGRAELSAQAFARELTRRTGARATKSGSTRLYRGIALIDDSHENDDRRYGE